MVQVNPTPSSQPQPPDVRAALSIADEISDLVDEIPEAGWEFAQSVGERAAAIAENIERHNRVTDAQAAALENMRDGLERWFE